MFRRIFAVSVLETYGAFHADLFHRHRQAQGRFPLQAHTAGTSRHLVWVYLKVQIQNIWVYTFTYQAQVSGTLTCLRSSTVLYLSSSFVSCDVLNTLKIP